MIPSEHPHLKITSATHEGMRGKNNEDRFGVFAHRLQAAPSRAALPVVFAILCDGIGGHRAGEVAAEIAVETVSKAIAAADAAAIAKNPLDILRAGIQKASQGIRAESEADSGRKGMGSTCVCAWVIDDRLYTAYVGDSRLFLVRAGQIQQITIDHTWVQEAMEYGVLTPEQARNHPNAHVIRRYLGSQEAPEVDFRLRLSAGETDDQSIANQGMRLQAGDILVLCSDGLSDLVEPAEVLKMVQSETREQAPQALVALANERGGHDNITVVLMEYPGQPAANTAPLKPATTAPTVIAQTTTAPTVIAQTPSAPKSQQRLARQIGISCLVAGGLGLLLLLLAGAGVWYLNSAGIIQLPWIASPTPTAAPAILTPPAIEFPTETLPVIETPTETQYAAPTSTPTAPPAAPAAPPTATHTPWPTNSPEPELSPTPGPQLTPPGP